MTSLYTVKIIYKKDIPVELMWFVQSNEMCSIIKNGVCEHQKVNMIAATIIVKDLNKKIDATNNPKTVIKNLTNLLERLLKTGQLVSSI